MAAGSLQLQGQHRQVPKSALSAALAGQSEGV